MGKEGEGREGRFLYHFSHPQTRQELVHGPYFYAIGLSGALGWTGPSEEHEGKGREWSDRNRSLWFFGLAGFWGTLGLEGHAGYWGTLGLEGKGDVGQRIRKKGEWGEDFCSLCFVGFEILVIFVARNDDS